MIKIRNRGATVITSTIFSILITILFSAGCKSIVERQDVRPRILRDVPAQRLAYRLEPDVSPPADLKIEDTDKIPGIQNDFSARRQDDALLRTVVSPDGKRALALYGTENEPRSAFRIDVYSADGNFLRNLIPPELSCVFPESVAWSPDGNYINFIAHKRVVRSSPTPPPDAIPDISPNPAPSVAPAFAPVAAFETEQIYICNRDGYDLKPLTSREGLIYFSFAWAPDNHALVALACKETEWNEREKEFKLPAGRPRLIAPDGQERLLDDSLTEALPVWSPDSSKVATAFDFDVGVYDAANASRTRARMPLRAKLISASIAFEQKGAHKKDDSAEKNSNAAPASSTNPVPASLNPIVRLEWPSPEKLFFETAYVRLMPNEAINTFQRWHLLMLSAQAAVLK
ncbi:MAG: TolB family protein [Pyrinomonadaceae bacterium]